jgi:hypothetical protein
MDGFVALMTPDFHVSDWTDQEVGHAVCRGVPTIAVNLGTTPYGFLARFQALTCDWASVHIEIVKILARQDKWFAGYVTALRKCAQFDEGNTMALALPWIERLSETQVDDLIGAYNDNPELQGAFGFNGDYPRKYGRWPRQSSPPAQFPPLPVCRGQEEHRQGGRAEEAQAED